VPSHGGWPGDQGDPHRCWGSRTGHKPGHLQRRSRPDGGTGITGEVASGSSISLSNT